MPAETAIKGKKSTREVPAKRSRTKLDRFLPWLLVVAGIIGLIASFVLTMDKMEMLENPGYQPSCNINPVIACGSVIVTSQASAFSFPNPFIGLVGFAVLITVGVTWLTGVRSSNKWYWRAYMAAALFGVAFVHWLAFQSIYRIGALCPYCMVVWVVTIAIFLYSLLWVLRQGYIRVPSWLDRVVWFANRNHVGILLSWYLVVVLLILNHFWYFFGR